MKGFKVHEDTAFEPYAPPTGGAPSKNLKGLGKGVISGPENADVPAKKHGKGGAKQQAKFGTKEPGGVAGEAGVDKRKAKKEEEAPEIEYAHRTEVAWHPPSAFDGMDQLAAHLRGGYAKSRVAEGGVGLAFPSPEIALELLPDLNDSFRAGEEGAGTYFDISIELNGDEFDDDSRV